MPTGETIEIDAIEDAALAGLHETSVRHERAAAREAVARMADEIRLLRKRTCRLCMGQIAHGYCERHAADMGVNKPLRSELMDPAAERRRLEGTE